MIPDWNTNCVLVASLLSQRHPHNFRELEAILSKHDVPLKVVANNRDIWIRDAAPVAVSSTEFVQFRYQPDYLQGYKSLITRPEAFNGLPFIISLQKSELVVDGGNIVGTESIAILTDKVLHENPNRSRSEIDDELKRLLQVSRVILIPQEPQESFGHSDGMVRFIDECMIVMNDYASVDPKFGRQVRLLLERNGLKIELLPYRPEGRKFDGIESAVGNFVNYLRVGNHFIIPSYGIPEDAEATLRLQTLCPEATVIPLDCFTLARKGGVLQCISWTIHIPEVETV